MGDNSTQIVSKALSDELLQFCESKSLSKDGLLEILHRHGLTPPNSSLNGRKYSTYFFCAACANELVDEEVICCLIEYFPDVFDNFSGFSKWTPLHSLCGNKNLREKESIKMLRILLEHYPDAARLYDHESGLPIHIAAGTRSFEFCRILIESYPGSARIRDGYCNLPLHCACECSVNTLPTVQYLYNLYPDAVNKAAENENYPIHIVILGIRHGYSDPAVSMKVGRFLLESNANFKLMKKYNWSLLKYTCWDDFNDSNLALGLQMIGAIYDAYPKAVEDYDIESSRSDFHPSVREFIKTQLRYARQARNHRQMTSASRKGQLPLHRVLQKNLRLGAIKLMVNGNLSAIRHADNKGAIPLHLACQYHDSPRVIQYLLSLDATSLDAVDRNGNTLLHYACRGAKHDTITMLLDKYSCKWVSKKNLRMKLPIDLLWESKMAGDRESVKYTNIVFRLLKENADVISNIGESANGQSNQQKRKKRKLNVSVASYSAS